MARSMNNVVLIGNVGQDPEVRTTGGGTKVANFSIATSPPWNDEETNWHKIVAWRNLADIVEKYVKRGIQVAVLGRIRYSSWTDQSGNNRKSTEIVADEIMLLGGGRSGSEATRNRMAPVQDQDDGEDSDARVPF